MHTSYFQLPDFGEVIVIHNGDWSGDAIVRWGPILKNPAHDGYTSGDKEYAHEVTLPAGLLLGIGRRQALNFVRDQVLDFIGNLKYEDMEKAIV